MESHKIYLPSCVPVLLFNITVVRLIHVVTFSYRLLILTVLFLMLTYHILSICC
jgi:hypothetical protein